MIHTDSEPEASRDFTGIIPPYRDGSRDAPELSNFAQLMNRAHAEMARMKPSGPSEELGHALDALSASFDEVDTTLKAIPKTVLTSSVLLQWFTATQALQKVVYVNWARDNGSPPLQSEDFISRPFPARLTSGRIVSID